MSDRPSAPAAPLTAQSVAAARALLAGARGRRKLSVILDAPDPRRFVRSLPAEDLYFALREIGLEDGAEVISLAAPAQFKALVDLDAWQKDLPDLEQLILWLRLSMEGAAHGPSFRAQRSALDPELIILLLKTHTTVHPLVEGEDPVLTSDNWLRTAEGKYLVEIHAEGDDGVTVRKLLEDFIAENPFEATRLFEAVRWEVGSELEENCLRWRSGRLRDMGFPETAEALRIWTPLPGGWKPRDQAATAGPVTGVPALLLRGVRGDLLLDRVAAALSDEARPLFNQGLVYLMNCALVADGVEPRELEFAEETLTATRDQLSLGLELACDGDEARALAILSTTPPVELFRLAVTRLTALQKEAAAAAATVSFGAGQGTAMPSPEAEQLALLRRRRPRLYIPPTPGEKPGPRRTERALRDRADLAAAEALIARTRTAGNVLAALGLTSDKVQRLADTSGHTAAAVTAPQLACTVVVARALGLADGALPTEALERVRQLFTDGRWTTAAREKLTTVGEAALASLPTDQSAVARTLLHQWITALEEELGPPSAAGPLEARFVDGLLTISAAD